MAEVLSTSSTQEVHKKSPPVHNENDFVAKYPDLTSTPQGKKISEKHANEKNQCDVCYLEAKQEVRQVTKEQLPIIRELKLTDIRSPAGLAYYIEQSDDRWIQSLEQTIGLDSTWKILTLTGVHTTVKILEAFVDILKMGEGMKNWVNALNSENMNKWEKAWAIANGIGTDGLRALAIAGPVLSKLWQVIENITISDNLFWYKSGNTFYQRWAVGDLEGIKPFSKEKQPNVHESIKASGRPKVLYEDPSYTFLASEKYQKLREIFPNLSQNDIIGEGNNAIILQHPNKWNRILKVAKEWARDDIIQEFNNHETFFKVLEKWKIDFPWQLSENVKIPEVKKWNWDSLIYFEMEKIDWLSFKSLFFREKYATQLEKAYSKEDLAKMSDAKLEWVMKELWLDPIPSVILNSDGWFSKALFSESQTFMWSRIRDPVRKKEYELWNTLSFLDWKWLRHTDMHSWNFMLSRDWKTTYIIDFWNTNLNIKK